MATTILSLLWMLVKNMQDDHPEKRITEEEDLDISLQVDILTVLSSLEEYPDREENPQLKPFQPASSMSITKDLWELFNQSSQYKIGSNEFSQFKKIENDLVVVDQKLPGECSFDELLDQALDELTSITDSIK